MRRSRKFIMVTVLATVVLVGSITGVALADNGNGNEPGALLGALWDRVAAIYQQKTGDTLDQEALQEAFASARAEMRQQALENRLQSLVEQDKLTQDEADQYLEWWQSKPDVTAKFGFRGHAGFPGMGGPRGWGGLCTPQHSE